MYQGIAAAAESGWDFSSRWLRDSFNLATIRTTEIIPIELNTYLWNMEQVLSKLMAATGDIEGHQQVRLPCLLHALTVSAVVEALAS